MNLADRITAGYLLLIALLVVSHHHVVEDWIILAGAHLLGVVAITALTLIKTKLPGTLQFFRDWHPYFLVLPLYREVEYLAAAFGNWGLTEPLERLEVSLFNGHPSIYLSQKLPWMFFSEYLHLSYLSYTLLFAVVGGYWYARGQRHHFAELLTLVLLTYYGSYLFFVLYPVDSPFYLFAKFGPPLSDGPFYKMAHFFSARGGARGGAFPSVHVSVSTVILWTAWRRNRRLGYALLPFVLGIYVATVYGRFHYAVDVPAGWLTAAAAIAVCRLTRTPLRRDRDSAP